jgi:hypothetical protein
LRVLYLSGLGASRRANWFGQLNRSLALGLFSHAFKNVRVGALQTTVHGIQSFKDSFNMNVL